MAPNRRKSERRKFNYPAKIDAGDGSCFQECLIADISQTGAKLVRVTGQPPDEFELLIGGIAGLRRRCRVVWRRDTQLGVRFAAVSPHG
jgi:PilZ domain